MAKIEIVSASAGSGKTWTIADEVTRRIRSGALAPERIVATTFTNKAAAELKQRIRARLFAEGMSEEALRLEGARIGTVNSVCGRLLQQFAFELGLSPVQRVLEDDAALDALRRAISAVVRPEESDAIARCERVMGLQQDDGDWTENVMAIAKLARSNRVAPDALSTCAKQSADGLLAYLGKAVKSGEALERELMEAAETFVAFATALPDDKQKGTKDKIPTVQQTLAALRRGNFAWGDWLRLVNLKLTKGGEAGAAPMKKAAARVCAHPRLHQDVREYITRLFDVAGRALAAFAAEKAAWGAVDFVDQEARALELVERDDVAERLRDEIELVVVDELQDTSPIQLALFARLAEIAKESIWVGDTKQAIYGFRGTDPALMDSALEALEGKAAQRTLETSWRSRAPLVELSSRLFAPPFEATGLPKERVVLKPKDKADHKALGAAMELWSLQVNKGERRANAVAACVESLLDDAKVKVRDLVTGEPRALRAGDIAVLCRRNENCVAVATALAARGRRAAVARPGLLSTPEARLGLAALRLFVDARDSLAAAELALLQEHADDPDAWLDAVLAPRAAEQPVFAEAPMHVALEVARARVPSPGPLAALDAALEAIGAHETCLRWGAAAERHANLDALRAHAVSYVGTCKSEGAAATPAGLIAVLEELAGNKADARAMVTGGDAVNVITWHAAKGLEWPVVVLDDLKFQGRARVWGATAQSIGEDFDFHAPLAGRWVRFWPHPFGKFSSSDFHQRIDAGAEAVEAAALAEEEELRLLYVGWTRARDRLALVLDNGELDVPQLGRFAVGDTDPLGPPDAKGVCTWAGAKVAVATRKGTSEEPERRPAIPDAAPVPAGERAHPPAWLSPSKLGQKGAVGAPVKIGERRKIVGNPDMDQLGTALHAFFAADMEGLSATQRHALAARCMKNRGVDGALSVDDVVAMGDALRAWVSTVAPGAVWRREWPVWRVMEDGSVVRGTADLVLEGKEGVVIVDHKSFPGSLEQAVERAAGYAGQLGAYAGVIEAGGGAKCLATYIHLPLVGVAVGGVG